VPDNELRVLHLLPHVHEIGNGIVDVTVDLAIAQAADGIPVVVASSGGEYVELLETHGVATMPLALRPGNLPRLRRILADVRPSVVHTHTLKGLTLARLARPGVPVLNTAHRDLGRWSVAMRTASRVLAVSDGIGQTVQRYVPAERIRVVRNGVLGGPRRGALLALPTPDLRHPALVFVGGMYVRKGVDVLLRAFARMVADGSDGGARLYLVGNGPDRSRFEELAGRLGLDGRVEWAGFRRDADAWMRGADVFVLPSLSETFGLVLAEARQAGVAIVATATGGIPEVLDGGRAGLLVPPGDVDALAAALATVLRDDDERARLRAAAAAGIDWLTVDRMHRDVLAEYDDVRGLLPSAVPS
jgi:glycosyltransferase involved in cell wall biosynthesis